jgi:hypothetical protein
MRKIGLIAAAAAVILAGVGGWATSTTKARVPHSAANGVEPFQLMTNAKRLPTANLVDYTFVFD